MLYLITKATLSGVIVMVVSEVAKRYPGIGGMIASLPLIFIMGILWLWRDTGDTGRVATHAEATFWFVLPSLPMFLLMPYLLRQGIIFWLSLIASCILTIVLYLATIWLLPKIGIKI